MGLFGDGKSDEEKYQTRVAKALEEMGISAETVGQPDGMVHAGCFQGTTALSYRTLSQLIEGVLQFLQKQGRTIVDVKVCSVGDSGVSALVTVLYR